MNSPQNRYFKRGIYTACAILLCIVLAWAVCSAIWYDGKCGGFSPGLSVRRPCSLLEYLFGDEVAIAMIFAAIYWPVVLALMILPSGREVLAGPAGIAPHLRPHFMILSG
jgi:hypothetical protein